MFWPISDIHLVWYTQQASLLAVVWFFCVPTFETKHPPENVARAFCSNALLAVLVQLMPDEFKAVLVGLFELSRAKFASPRDAGEDGPAAPAQGEKAVGGSATAVAMERAAAVVGGEEKDADSRGEANEHREHDEVRLTRS